LPSISAQDNLSDQQNVTVVLRLVTDRQGRLLHGEILDASGASLARFFRWPDLTRLLQTHLATIVEDRSPDSP
jgi:hypothetical protein